MRVQEALEKCPDIQLVHVQTISDNLEVDEDDDNQGDTAHNNEGAMKKRRLTHKACLERYRKASAEIRALVHKLVPNVPLEKVF